MPTAAHTPNTGDLQRAGLLFLLEPGNRKPKTVRSQQVLRVTRASRLRIKVSEERFSISRLIGENVGLWNVRERVTAKRCPFS